MSDFNALFQSLKSSVEDYVKSNAKDHFTDVAKDARAFLEDSKSDLQKYTMQLEQGIITKEKFESLMLDMKDNLKLEGALQAGLSQIKADQIKSGIITMLTQTVFRILL
jgi:hypothetical protein